MDFRDGHVVYKLNGRWSCVKSRTHVTLTTEISPGYNRRPLRLMMMMMMMMMLMMLEVNASAHVAVALQHVS